MAKFLVIRLSAIGDVAMTIPVIYSVARENPEHEFTVLTQPFLTSLFINKPTNIEVISLDIKRKEKSLWGVLRFTSTLLENKYDFVLDLHDVLRTKVIRNFLKLNLKTKVRIIDKARKERKQLTRPENKILKPLLPVIERYANVFKSAGLNYTDHFISLFDHSPAEVDRIETFTGEKKEYWIGIAPFAKHIGKVYPLEKMERVISSLSKKENVTIFLLGGKGEEEKILKQWANTYSNIKNVASEPLSLDKELILISQLNLLLSMDSANMHFASLVNTRVVSIWGSTHPFAGFYGYKQNPEDIIQLDLSCRPCSVFGNKPCMWGDYRCLSSIEPDYIIKKLEDILGNENSN